MVDVKNYYIMHTLGAKINYHDVIFNVTRMQQLIFRTLALHFLVSFTGENFEVKASLD
jgi:hypothetical protein